MDVKLSKIKPEIVEPTERRLLNVKQAAAYLGISTSLVRSYIAHGILREVLLPDPVIRKARTIRRTLVDKRRLDEFIDRLERRSHPNRPSQEQAAERQNKRKEKSDV